jgi:deoxyribonuclease-4
MSNDQPYYGAHLSIKNGITSALDEIVEVGGNLIQIFVSNPMSTKCSFSKEKYNEKTFKQIREKLESTETKLVIHLPYVINLAKPLEPDSMKSWWIDMICKHLVISEAMGSIGCVVHVGKYLKLTETEGLENMYESLKLIIDFIRKHNMSTHIILETAAGQGTELITTSNNSLVEFANFYNRFDESDKAHIKICIDTCHIFAAGYDIREKSQVKEFFDQFNEHIGLEHIDLIHLNDSEKGCGSCVDRHANLGKGAIGIEGLRHFIRYGIYYKIPMVLETPDGYVEEIALINEVKNGVKNWMKKNDRA